MNNKSNQVNSSLIIAIPCSYFVRGVLQIQLMDAKRQQETQVALHQKTKELLNAAELELNALRLQQGSGEARHPLSTPSTPIIRGTYAGWGVNIHSFSSVNLKRVIISLDPFWSWGFYVVNAMNPLFS